MKPAILIVNTTGFARFQVQSGYKNEVWGQISLKLFILYGYITRNSELIIMQFIQLFLCVSTTIPD
jgi:hypothetical protein